MVEKTKRTKLYEEKSSHVIFQDMLPQEILEQLTPEVRRQYFIWDEIFKRELEIYPWLILPVIKEVFQKKYPKGTSIRLLSTEYVVDRIHEHGERTLNSIHADILMQIERDIYHFECQLEKDKDMVLRMLEYDMHIALSHGVNIMGEQAVEVELVLPKSAIIYLDYPKKALKEERYNIKFADGTFHAYKVPILKVQDYSPEMIEEKHLNMLIPFLPLKFKKYLNYRDKYGNKKVVSKKALKDLTDLISKCMMIIHREKESGVLTELAGKDILGMLERACSHLFRNEPEIFMEVRNIMEPAFKLISEEKEEVVRQKELLEEKLENGIRNLIEKESSAGYRQVKEMIQSIFLLSEQETDEKMRKYWKD